MSPQAIQLPVALSPSSRNGATLAPAGAASPAEALLTGLISSDENHPESVYDACHANYTGPDLHTVPAFSRVGESRFAGRNSGEGRQ